MLKLCQPEINYYKFQNIFIKVNAGQRKALMRTEVVFFCTGLVEG